MPNKLITRCNFKFLQLLSLIFTILNQFYHVFSLKGCAPHSSAWKLHLRKGAASLFCDKQQRKKNATITLLALLLLLIIPICLATGNIILDKSIYGLDETVKISLINITTDDTLSIISDKDVFKYSGELKSELEFYPRETGDYYVRLSNGEIIDEASFSVREDSMQNIADANNQNISETPNILYTDKKEYLLNEPVEIFLNTTGEYELVITSETEVFKYLDGMTSPLSFIPRTAGKYRIELRKELKTIALAEFNVSEQAFSPAQSTHAPKIISIGVETIPQPNGATEQALGEGLNITLPFNLNIRDKKGISEKPGMRVLRAAGNAYDLEISPNKAGIGSIRFNNITIGADKTFLLDEISLKKEELKQKFTEKRIIRSFFIDTSELNFTNGSITSIASGKELWKCKNWDATQEACLGSWQKIMDLTPGETYEIIIAPEDPAYIETGVASINTKKPIYYPGETAEIIIVVLDTAGFLVSNADVSLEITAPDNTTTLLTTSQGNITETSKGIYEANYPGTSTILEGNYSLDVRAIAENVNSTMLSYFTVKSYYEFDIIRSTPVTTDPWQGAFASSIRIISHTDSTIFNFTEALPDSFQITDTGGATITTSNNKTYLTWANLNNESTISYSAIPPLISPELYALGPSLVSYDENTFYEARPWYLAVDPYRTDLLPDGDGAFTTWTIAGSAPAATRWQSVDDPVGASDNGTTYIASPLSVAGNSFTFQNLSDQGVVINWVAVRVYTRRAAVSSAIGIFYRQGGTNYNNTVANQTLTSTWVLYSLAGWNYTTNPANGLAWNESAINNMEWGVRRTSGTVAAWVTQMYITVGYNITNNAPNVTALNYPGNMSNITNSTVPFNFTVTDDRGFGNCTLYTNVTGAWAANLTNTNIINNSVNNITVIMPDGNYLWNIRCWDNISPPLSDWYDYNYTVHIDTTGPNTTIGRPANFSNVTANVTTTYMVNATVVDFTSIDTVTFFYRVNATDTWTFACSDNRGPAYDCLWDLTGLTDGRDYQVLAYANDTFGFVGNASTRINITVDTHGPNTTLDWPANFTNITTGTYRLNASAFDFTGVNRVTFMYRQNASDTWKLACSDTVGPEYNCTWNLAAVPEGKDYQIYAYANDTFGQLSNNDTHTNITIDRGGPNTTLDQPANFTNITTTTYVLNATSIDTSGVDTVTFYYRINSTDTWKLACTDDASAGPSYNCTWDVSGLRDGNYYQIRAQANDTLGFLGNNNTHTNLTIDLRGPNITLSTPLNQSSVNSTVIFVYTVNDTGTTVSNCSLIINDDVVRTNYSVPEIISQNFTHRISMTGWYNWSINCSDAFGNNNVSITRTVYIIRPNLVITSGNITLSNTTPREGDNITINATIFNIGGSDAINVTTQFFLGNPDAGGTQINGNFTDNITERTGNQPNANYTVNWTVTGPGPFRFFVVVDPPTATNGIINETNETNNKANFTLNVSAYNYFYGSADNNFYLGNIQNQSIYLFANLTNVTGNIFVADENSQISFSTLQAIGRNVNNVSVSNDYNDTDTALGMTLYNDSIRRVFTANTDIPTLTKTITVFRRQINNVPIINSTNTSSFITGMLWDTSDGNVQYNGTQDLLFVTQINKSRSGKYGTYDYEVRVPVNLKNYRGSGANVVFYIEINQTLG